MQQGAKDAFFDCGRRSCPGEISAEGNGDGWAPGNSCRRRPDSCGYFSDGHAGPDDPGPEPSTQGRNGSFANIALHQ